MEELIKDLKSRLEDEDKAGNDYDSLIDLIDKADGLSAECKILATVIVEKIKSDESTHYEMLNILYNTVYSMK